MARLCTLVPRARKTAPGRCERVKQHPGQKLSQRPMNARSSRPVPPGHRSCKKQLNTPALEVQSGRGVMEHSWPVVQRLAARATCSLLSAGLPACQHVLTARRSAPALGATVAQRCGPRLEISAAAAMRPAAAAARALAPPGEGTRRLSGAWASGVEWSEESDLSQSFGSIIKVYTVAASPNWWDRVRARVAVLAHHDICPMAGSCPGRQNSSAKAQARALLWMETALSRTRTAWPTRRT